jgi:hypothetical protein
LELAAQGPRQPLAWQSEAHENLVRTRRLRVSLTFPTLEFSMCERIPPAGCRVAGPEGFEPPSTSVLETGALPLSYVPSQVQLSKQKPPARTFSWRAASACGLRVGYMSGTAPPVESSINLRGEAYCVPRSMLGCQVFNGFLP